MSTYLCDPCSLGVGLPDISDLGDAVVLNGLELNTGGAFMCLNSYVLTDPAPKRRNNVTIPLRHGTLGRRSYRDQRTVDLEVRVSGNVNVSGEPYADPIAGVEQNIDALEAFTIDAAEDDYGCIWVGVARKSGELLLGPVQVDDFVAQPGRGDRIVVITLTIPSGYLPVFSED